MLKKTGMKDKDIDLILGAFTGLMDEEPEPNDILNFNETEENQEETQMEEK